MKTTKDIKLWFDGISKGFLQEQITEKEYDNCINKKWYSEEEIKVLKASASYKTFLEQQKKIKRLEKLVNKFQKSNLKLMLEKKGDNKK